MTDIRNVEPAEGEPGPMWIPETQVNRMMTECRQSTAKKLEIDRKVLEGLLHDSLLWRKDRLTTDVNVRRAKQLKELLDSWASEPDPDNDFQARVYDWMRDCFQRPDAMLPQQRSFRFLEEALELAQASGTGREDALRLVDYVYSRPPGDVCQEIGGVQVSLAALATSFQLSIEYAAEAELARCNKNTEKIRAKDLAKPERSTPSGPTGVCQHWAACPIPTVCNPIHNGPCGFRVARKRADAIEGYVSQFDINQQPSKREAFADGWDACYMQRPQRARVGTLEVGATEDRREVVINAPFTPDNGTGFVHFAFTPRQAIGLGEALFRKSADCLPQFARDKGAERHPTLVAMALSRATTLRATHITNPEHDYIVALADSYLAAVSVNKLWQTACTGRHGSQEPCVRSEEKT